MRWSSWHHRPFPCILNAGLGVLCLLFMALTYYSLHRLPTSFPGDLPAGRSIRRVYLARDIVRVLMTPENGRLRGAIAAMNSVVSNTHSPVHFYLVTDNATVHHLWSWIESTKLRNVSYEIKVFDESRVKGKNSLDEFDRPLSYARLFVEEIVTNDTERLVYLDDDVIVQGDIRDLANVRIKPGHVGAFSEDCDVVSKRANRYGNRYGNYMNVRHPRIAHLGINSSSCIFNIGVYVISMSRWKEHAITHRVAELMSLNEDEKHKIYHGDGPLSLMLITLYGKVTPLDPMWHVRHLGLTRGPQHSKKFLKEAKLFHWDGSFKPWGIRPPHAHLWNKYYIPDPQGLRRNLLMQ